MSLLTNVAAERLPIADESADRAFRQHLTAMSIDPNEQFAGDYANYEWAHSRHIFEMFLNELSGKPLLEFGCHLGGTAVVLAKLGASISAVDVTPSFCKATELNAARYGETDKIKVTHVEDTRRLPFTDESFAAVSINSVLEYVPHDFLSEVQKEIDRVTRKGGLIFVLGTSNRWWPREVHSKQLLSNYVPHFIDRLTGRPLRRGVSPTRVRSGFGRGYVDLGRSDRGALFIEAKRRMGWSGGRLRAASSVATALAPLGLSIGMLMPSSWIILRKPG